VKSVTVDQRMIPELKSALIDVATIRTGNQTVENWAEMVVLGIKVYRSCDEKIDDINWGTR